MSAQQHIKEAQRKCFLYVYTSLSMLVGVGGGGGENALVLG